MSGSVDPKSSYNLIGDGDSLTGIKNGVQVDMIGSAKAGKVIDAKLGPLADNGGPTETVTPLPGSPAIGAGKDGSNIGADVSRSTRPHAAHPNSDSDAHVYGGRQSAARLAGQDQQEEKVRRQAPAVRLHLQLQQGARSIGGGEFQNYQMDTDITKKVRKKVEYVPHTIKTLPSRSARRATP